MQVAHHGLAERAGLGEAVPLLKQRLHDVGDESCEKHNKGSVEELRFMTRDKTVYIDRCIRMCALTYLNGWDRVSLLVTQRTNLQVKLSLQVTCWVQSQHLEGRI